MAIEERLGATLPPGDEQEVEDVPKVECAKCGQAAEIRFSRGGYSHGQRALEFRGVITCTCEDGHQWPMAIGTNDLVLSTEQMMPVQESDNLNEAVPPGLIQDIEEAERCHFTQVYKASVVMCRRACQLGLAFKPHCIPDGPFTQMIEKAKDKDPAPLTPGGFIRLDTVKDYGDTGAHRTEEIAAGEARDAIFSAVKVLNELFS